MTAAAVTTADAQTRAQLEALEDRRRRALIDGDVDALDAIFDPTLIHVHAPGLVHDKARLLEHVATRRAYVDVTRGTLDIRVIGDVAIVVGPISNILRTPEGGVREQHGMVTQVARRTDDGWQYLSFQLTPLGEEVWGKLPSEQAAQEECA